MQTLAARRATTRRRFIYHQEKYRESKDYRNHTVLSACRGASGRIVLETLSGRVAGRETYRRRPRAANRDHRYAGSCCSHRHIDYPEVCFFLVPRDKMHPEQGNFRLRRINSKKVKKHVDKVPHRR